MDIHESNKMVFKVALSNEIDDKYKKDFINVCCQVFGDEAMNSDVFNRKYIDNIYGVSILVVVYSGNQPVAARGLWRNDIMGKKAYQPCDTSVLKEYRGKGVFALMTKLAIDKLDKEDLIYNFPNQNSYTQYLKLGWNDYISYRTTIMISIKGYKEEHPEIIDDEYLKWWIKPNNKKYFIYCLGDDAFLVKKRKWNIYFVVGRISPRQTQYFQTIKTKFVMLFYYSATPKFYNKKRIPINIVFKPLGEMEGIRIPIWKMDAI
jgi:hypothetical protein